MKHFFYYIFFNILSFFLSIKEKEDLVTSLKEQLEKMKTSAEEVLD